MTAVVLSVAEAPPRPFTVAEVARPVSVDLAPGEPVNLPRADRRYYTLDLTTNPAVTTWEASFDGGLTWIAGAGVAGFPNRWRWLVRGPDYVVADAVASTLVSRTTTPRVRFTDTPERESRTAPTIYVRD